MLQKNTFSATNAVQRPRDPRFDVRLWELGYVKRLKTPVSALASRRFLQTSAPIRLPGRYQLPPDARQELPLANGRPAAPPGAGHGLERWS